MQKEEICQPSWLFDGARVYYTWHPKNRQWNGGHAAITVGCMHPQYHTFRPWVDDAKVFTTVDLERTSHHNPGGRKRRQEDSDNNAFRAVPILEDAPKRLSDLPAFHEPGAAGVGFHEMLHS